MEESIDTVEENRCKSGQNVNINQLMKVNATLKIRKYLEQNVEKK